MPVTPSEFDPQVFPKKLNLGCGFDHREGYLNVDMNSWHGPDLLADVRRLDFLPAQHYDEILAQDVLEHLPRNDTVRVLAHWNRLLKDKGRIVIRVPSVLGIARLLTQPENQMPAKQEELIQCLFGTQAYSGDFHFTSFTEVILKHYLGLAGFHCVSISLLHGWLFDVIGEKVTHMQSPPLIDLNALLAIRADDEFVRACYLEILGRDPDPSGSSFYLNNLANGQMNRQVVMDIMTGSPEFQARRRQQ